MKNLFINGFLFAGLCGAQTVEASPHPWTSNLSGIVISISSMPKLPCDVSHYGLRWPESPLEPQEACLLVSPNGVKPEVYEWMYIDSRYIGLDQTSSVPQVTNCLESECGNARRYLMMCQDGKSICWLSDDLRENRISIESMLLENGIVANSAAPVGQTSYTDKDCLTIATPTPVLKWRRETPTKYSGVIWTLWADHREVSYIDWKSDVYAEFSVFDSKGIFMATFDDEQAAKEYAEKAISGKP